MSRRVLLGPGAPAAHFAGNAITTSKYNILTFVPIFLFVMFSRVAYLYFLLQARSPARDARRRRAGLCCVVVLARERRGDCGRPRPVAGGTRTRLALLRRVRGRAGRCAAGRPAEGLPAAQGPAVPACLQGRRRVRRAGQPGLVGGGQPLHAVRADHRAGLRAAGGGRQGRGGGPQAPRRGPAHQQQHRARRAGRRRAAHFVPLRAKDGWRSAVDI